MRLLFVLLLLANFTLALWQLFFTADGSPPPRPPIPPGERLVLLSERGAAPVPEQDETPLPEIVLAEEGGADEDPAAPAGPAAGQGAGRGETAVETAVEEAAPEPPPPAERCYTLGPFRSAAAAEAAARRLRALGAEVEMRSKTDRELYGYWVYLESPGGRERAAELARELATHGIEEYYIVTDDPAHENAVSLGLFRRKEGAIRRMAQVRRYGFKPRLELRYRDIELYWLDYRHPAAVDSDGVWRALKEKDPELQRLDGC